MRHKLVLLRAKGRLADARHELRHVDGSQAVLEPLIAAVDHLLCVVVELCAESPED
ncbi:MAG TPA: hypothetical protein VGD78_20940 [Chthoniobacterales bacterium]